jgi:hypothetical protein
MSRPYFYDYTSGPSLLFDKLFDFAFSRARIYCISRTANTHYRCRVTLSTIGNYYAHDSINVRNPWVES